MIPVINIDKIRENSQFKLLSHRENSNLYISKTMVVKLFPNYVLSYFENTGYSLEARIKESERFKGIPGLNLPTKIIKAGDKVIGYALPPRIKGKTIGEFSDNNYDLKAFADIHSKIERTVRAAHELGMVFPDLCNPGNIIITPKGEPVFIDFDSFQIDKMVIYNYSIHITPLNVLEELGGYDHKTNLFTPKADSISAAILIFMTVFHLSLHLNINELDYFLSCSNVESKNIRIKLRRILSQGNENEYLGSNLEGLANSYTLTRKPYSVYPQLEKK